MCWLAEKVPTLISGRSGKVLEVAVRNVLLMHREVWKWGLYSQLPASGKWLRGDFCSFPSTSQGEISISLQTAEGRCPMPGLTAGVSSFKLGSQKQGSAVPVLGRRCPTLPALSPKGPN